MKIEIQQVLKMNKDGILTDEQAADLLAELAKSGPNSRTAPGFEWNEADLVKPLVSKVNSTLKTALDATFGGASAIGLFAGAQTSSAFGGTTFGGADRNFGSKSDGTNAIHMSKFDAPRGESFVFQGNTIRMSSVKELSLDRSEMTGNTIDMSKVEEMILREARLVDSEMRASSVEEWRLSNSTVSGLSVQGSKVHEFAASADCVLDGMRIQGSSFKEFTAMDHVRVNGMMFNGAAVSELALRRSEVAGAEFQASRISDLSIEDSQVRNTLMRGTVVHKTVLAHCRFDDVLFSGLEKWGWKKRGLENVRFENCNLNKVLFSDCRLSKTILKNLSLNNQKFQDLDLTGLTLDGNDAFLAAVSAKR